MARWLGRHQSQLQCNGVLMTRCLTLVHLPSAEFLKWQLEGRETIREREHHQGSRNRHELQLSAHAPWQPTSQDNRELGATWQRRLPTRCWVTAADAARTALSQPLHGLLGGRGCNGGLRCWCGDGCNGLDGSCDGCGVRRVRCLRPCQCRHCCT